MGDLLKEIRKHHVDDVQTMRLAWLLSGTEKQKDVFWAIRHAVKRMAAKEITTACKVEFKMKLNEKYVALENSMTPLPLTFYMDDSDREWFNVLLLYLKNLGYSTTLSSVKIKKPYDENNANMMITLSYSLYDIFRNI